MQSQLCNCSNAWSYFLPEAHPSIFERYVLRSIAYRAVQTKEKRSAASTVTKRLIPSIILWKRPSCLTSDDALCTVRIARFKTIQIFIALLASSATMLFIGDDAIHRRRCYSSATMLFIGTLRLLQTLFRVLPLRRPLCTE